MWNYPSNVCQCNVFITINLFSSAISFAWCVDEPEAYLELSQTSAKGAFLQKIVNDYKSLTIFAK